MNNKPYHIIPLKLTPLLHALSHPARVQIILNLAEFKGCQAGSISNKLPLAKSTVSEHLSKLKEAGLIKSLADGNCIYYSTNDEMIALVKGLFNDLFSAIGQLQENRIECCSVPKHEKLKCKRVYEICKSLHCFSNNCYPSDATLI